jgi:DNA-binding winged helix-turn-helix (wHTH) protein/Flp pilus assembly protein TadD
MLARDGVIYEFGSVRINLLNRTLEREGEIVHLPARAFDVLLLLLNKRGEIVSKEELLSAIWPDTHVEESSLPVMISSIRRAIGDDGRAQKHIQTVARCGYRLIGQIREIPIPAPAAPAASSPAQRLAFWQSRHSRTAAAAMAMVLFAASFLAGSGIRASYSRQPRSSAAAWYEKGRYAWNLQTKSSILHSLEYYWKAIAADPDYAPAWAGLAESYVSLPSYSHSLRQPDLDSARNSARRAVEIAPELAESHIAQGMVSMIAEREFPKAEKELRRAVELDPDSPLAQGELGLLLVASGNPREAIEHARRASELDGLSIRAATDLGIVLFYGQRYEEAKKEFEEVLKLDPYSYRAQVNLGRTCLALGRFKEAREFFNKACALSDHDPIAEGYLALAAAREGDRSAAQSIVSAMEQRSHANYVAPGGFARAYLGLGQYDRVIENLRKAYDDRTITAIFLKVDPNWRELRSDPEFETLTRDLP